MKKRLTDSFNLNRSSGQLDTYDEASLWCDKSRSNPVRSLTAKAQKAVGNRANIVNLHPGER